MLLRISGRTRRSSFMTTCHIQVDGLIRLVYRLQGHANLTAALTSFIYKLQFNQSAKYGEAHDLYSQEPSS